MSKQSFIIGRAGDVTLYDDTVSRRHACLEVEDEGMFLRDLESRNGTYEIRDKKLVPFASGAVYPDQVFAFGECVRSVEGVGKPIFKIRVCVTAGDAGRLVVRSGRGR